MSEELAIDSKALIFATLADVYLSAGMIDEAIAILKDGLTRNPNYTLAKITLGRAHYLKGNIAEALTILEEIYNSAKESENENLYLGHCYNKLGENDRAVKFYEAVLKINPQNEEAKRELAILKQATTPVEVKKEAKVEKEPEKEVKPEIAKTEEMVSVAQVVTPVPEPVRKAQELVPEKEEEPLLPEIGLEPIPEPAVTTAPLMPFERLTEPIGRLLNLKTVKGAIICSKDGLLIQNYYRKREDVEDLCALVAAIYNEADESFKFLKVGLLEKCIIEKHDETICVITAGDSLFCIITQPEAKPGLVFVYARKIIEEIREILG